MTVAINKMLNSISKLAQAQMPKGGNGLTYGRIKSLDPLSIRVDNYNFDLPAEFFVLGQMVRPHTVTIPHKHEYNGFTEETNDGGQGASSHKHEIKQQVTEDLHEGTGGYSQDSVTLEIEPKLQVGDKVLLFSFNEGQKYYVAERILEDENEE